jgi:chromosome segregation ATPase
MRRLFEGRPQRTDGRLTKENLWKEAQVSRATMNRARSVLDDWDAHTAEHGTTTAGEARRDEQIAELRRKLADKTRQCTDLQNKLKAAATAIAALHHDNETLRDEIGRHGSGVVVDIGLQRRRAVQPS